MAISFLDMRGQEDFAYTLIQNAGHQTDRAVVFLRASSCEFTRKAAFSYVCMLNGDYLIGSHFLDKYYAEKQAYKHALYRTVQIIKGYGVKEINLVLVDEGYFLSLEGKSDHVDLRFSGSVLLIDENAPLAVNRFLSYLNELYKGYIPPNGIRIKTKGLDEVLRWLEFIQGSGNFETHIDVPSLKELKNIFVEVIEKDKSVLIRYGHLCWMVFDWLMRQEKSRQSVVDYADVRALALNYYDYFHSIDPQSVRLNKMGLERVNLSKDEKVSILRDFFDTSTAESANRLNQKVQIYRIKQEPALDTNALIKQCKDIYAYHWSLVQFKAELFESNADQQGSVEKNMYHAVAKWLHSDVTGNLRRVENGKMEQIQKSVFCFYMSLLGEVVEVDQIWKLERAVVLEEAAMLIEGLDFAVYVEKQAGEDRLCILNSVNKKMIRINLSQVLDYMKKHHSNPNKSPISLEKILRINS